jgi:hypothetical protein
MVTAQNSRGRRDPAPNPFKPPRRSNRECVVKKGASVMPVAEESDSTLPEDEYLPGKSLIFSLAPRQAPSVLPAVWIGFWLDWLLA